MNTARQYDVLARACHLSARLRGGVRPHRLCLHKSLLPPAPADGRDPGPAGGREGLNQWLAERVARAKPKRVLDLGCGFGSTLFALAQGHKGEFVGLTQSAFMVQTATSLAGQAGLAGNLRFFEGEFAKLRELERFDSIIALESLSYFDDLTRAARLLASALRTKGTLWIVDDWLREPLPPEHPDVHGICESWGRVRMHTVRELDEALAKEGFQNVETRDLTAQVPASVRSPSRSTGIMRWAARHLPGRQLRALAAAYLGGFHLERLYATSAMEYRFSHYIFR
jgi:SAM-dependent methyltransferase